LGQDIAVFIVPSASVGAAVMSARKQMRSALRGTASLVDEKKIKLMRSWLTKFLFFFTTLPNLKTSIPQIIFWALNENYKLF
jgi:hypothetical protein